MRQLTLFAVAVSVLVMAPEVDAQEQSATEDRRIFLEADKLTEDRNAREIIAEGGVRIRYRGRTLEADRLVYNLETRRVKAEGGVKITDPDGSIRYAEAAEVDENLSDGEAIEFSTTIDGVAEASAGRVVRENDSKNIFEDLYYTSCSVCEETGEKPTWAIRAGRAVQNEETQMLSYRGAVLEVEGLPVLYLPYFTHADPTSERRSGLLFPSFGLSGTLGGYYQQPYLQVISPSQDFTIAPQVNGKVNPFVEWNYRKRFYSGIVEFDGSLAHDFIFNSQGERAFFDDRGNVVRDPDSFTGNLNPSEESTRSHVFGRGIFQINEDYKWGFGAERSSDDDYLLRYDLPGDEKIRGIYQAATRQLISQLYLIRQKTDSYADVSLLSFQDQAPRANNDLTPTVAPYGYADRLWDLGNRGIVNAQLQTTYIERSDGDDYGRATALANWTRPEVVGGGLVVEPFGQIRADYIDFNQVENVATPDSESFVRASGHVGANVSWPLLRTGERFNVLIEPTAMAAYGDASVENDELLNEESPFFEMDETRLFEPNGLGGYDHIETGGRFAAGVTSRVDIRNGPSFSAFAGRRWRSEADPSFSETNNLDGTVSDYLVGGKIDFGRRFDIAANFRLDDEGELQRVDTRAAVNFWRLRGSANYYKLSEDLSPLANNPNPAIAARAAAEEGVLATAIFRVTDNWNLSFRQLRDITENRNSALAFGIQYVDDCTFFSVEYQKQEINSDLLDDSESIKFRIGLRTLGTLGDSNFD